MGEAILAARGSVLEEPQRSRLARAVARAAVEVERVMVEPRYLVRRDDERALIALHPSLADYAARLQLYEAGQPYHEPEPSAA